MKKGTLVHSCKFIDEIAGNLTATGKCFVKFLQKLGLKKASTGWDGTSRLIVSKDALTNNPSVNIRMSLPWSRDGVFFNIDLNVKVQATDFNEIGADQLNFMELSYPTAIVYLFLRENFLVYKYDFKSQIEKPKSSHNSPNFTLYVKVSKHITAQITSLAK